MWQYLNLLQKYSITYYLFLVLGIIRFIWGLLKLTVIGVIIYYLTYAAFNINFSKLLEDTTKSITSKVSDCTPNAISANSIIESIKNMITRGDYSNIGNSISRCTPNLPNLNNLKDFMPSINSRSPSNPKLPSISDIKDAIPSAKEVTPNTTDRIEEID